VPLNRLVRSALGWLPPLRGVYARRDERRLRENHTADTLARLTRVPLFAPPGHFYSPIVDPDHARAHFARSPGTDAVQALPGIDLDLPRMLDVWSRLLPYLRTAPFREEARPGLRYRYDNGAYAHGDGAVLHAVLRLHRPRRIVEVGSGWSSACTIDTVEGFLDGDCDVTFIEPFPELLQQLLGATRAPTTILPHGVQQTPLSVFEALEPNDVLFIDSTHVLATGSDVQFELFEALPRLKPGVIVHFHDVFWPFEYPWAWAVEENRSWNELYGLRAFLTNNAEWRILFFNDYFGRMARDVAQETFPTFLKNPGGALWLVKQ
jgi:hypothetical protein